MALLDVTRGNRPDITPAQIVGALLTAVPNLLVLLGVELSGEKSVALGGLIAIGVTLIGGDAYLRGKRNEADAMKSAAAGQVERAGVGSEPHDGEFEDEDDDPTGEEHVPEDVTLPAAAPPEQPDDPLSVLRVPEGGRTEA